MLTRKEKQFIFAENVAHLIMYMKQEGYNPVLGFSFRCEACPVGKENSNHKICLAIDIELHDKNGKYLTETKDHEKFGIWWESLHRLNRWGGRFGDGNHYSMFHNGVI